MSDSEEKRATPERKSSISPIRARRISVVGTTGSGKSSLARRLAKKTGLPVHHLDQLRLSADGTELSETQFAAVVADLVGGEEWIVDGHYRSVRHTIWSRADQIVWLDYPLRLIMYWLLTRNLKKRRASRDRRQADALSRDGPARVQAASWYRRMTRFRRALGERSEYSRLLTRADYGQADVVRLRTANAGRKWLRSADRPSSRPKMSESSSRAGSLRLIELFSVPGAGKSTLTDALVIDSGFQTRDGLSDAWRERGFIRQTAIVLRGLSDQACLRAAVRLAIGARLTSPRSLRRLVRLLAKSHWIRSQSGTVMLDQGHLQSIWSILIRSGATELEPETIAPLIRALFRGTSPQLVYIHVPVKVAAERISGRRHGDSPMDGLPVDLATEKLSRMAELFPAILAAAKKAGLSVEVLDGMQSPLALREAASAALCVPNSNSR